MSNEWIEVSVSLPISGVDDQKYKGGFYEIDVDVIADGKEQTTIFWACHEEKTPYGPENNLTDEFLMEFEVDGVTHWRYQD